jgi:hypothetical protein
VVGEVDAVRGRTRRPERASEIGLRRSTSARVGTIKKRYGTPDYRAFEVLFPDGQTELFWDHQLEEVKGDPPLRTKRMWVFW